MTVTGDCPALVLNADFRPLSYFPLSLWSWQDSVKAVFLDRVNIISEYENEVRSPTFAMRLPSVIALKQYVPVLRRPAGHVRPDLRSRHSEVAGRRNLVDERRRGVFGLQSGQGEPFAEGMRHGAGTQARRAVDPVRRL